MQNEITELRNQVRTLKRIVYGFGCLLVAGVVIGATSLQTVPDVIQAKKFEVVNDEEIAVVTLESFEDSGVIHTTDSLGYINFLVMSEKDSNGITCGRVEVQNANTKALVVLTFTSGSAMQDRLLILLRIRGLLGCGFFDETGVSNSNEGSTFCF